jgi:ubiquinone/menaquinone biosynthesis C-methylase UbiE/diadenosine tetraphosphate (Ap4A) HIT family hydrolase
MIASSVSPQICDLCREVLLGGTAVTGAYLEPTGIEPYSRLIFRTSVVDVLAGLGSMVPGYVLLLPRRHVRSMGELAVPEMTHVFELAWRMRDRISEVFGGDVVLVEHGSSGHHRSASGACIDHAHIHLFPLSPGADPGQFMVPNSHPISGISELSSIAQLGKNYYFCAFGRFAGYVAVEPRLESQQARRVWAEALGMRDEWDWAAFPFLTNAHVTTTKLRPGDSSPGGAGFTLDDDELGETLRAYDEAADWYAACTSAFPETSSLRDEMSWLAAHSDGPILDAGSGAGRDAAYLAKFHRTVIALDASAPLLSHVPKRKNISNVVGDVRRLLLDNDSIGAIWCSAVLLHLRRDDVLSALREFFRVLKPEGLAEVSVKEGTGQASSPMPDHPWLRRHFFFYEGEELNELARRAGLKVEKTWTEDEMDSSQVVQRWVKLRLRKP